MQSRSQALSPLPSLSVLNGILNRRERERERERESLGSRLIEMVNMKSHGTYEVQNFLPLGFFPDTRRGIITSKPLVGTGKTA